MFKLFKKKKKKDHNRYIRMKIREVRSETPEANTIVFEAPEESFSYAPGQFLTILVPVDGKEVRRSYSLSSSPQTDQYPAITVKRIESGNISNFIHHHMKKGDEFDVMGPMGHFTPELDLSQEKHYVLMAGGSGITPLFSIMKSVLEVEKHSTVTLIYQSRNTESEIFYEALNTLQDLHSDRLKIERIYSQPESSWSGYNGRLSEAMIDEILKNYKEEKETHYFLCGPAGMMTTCENIILKNDVSGHIHKESFYSSENTENTDHDVSEKDIVEREVTIILDGQEHKVTVSPKKSILQAALDKDLDMPFSCQSGICSACRGKLIKGKVYMEEDEGLSNEEIEEGYILNCVSHPQTDDVVIEIG